MKISEPRVSPRSNGQHARFIETARALGCDEDEAAFDEKLRRIARQKKVGEKVQEPPET